VIPPPQFRAATVRLFRSCPHSHIPLRSIVVVLHKAGRILARLPVGWVVSFSPGTLVLIAVLHWNYPIGLHSCCFHAVHYRCPTLFPVPTGTLLNIVDSPIYDSLMVTRLITCNCSRWRYLTSIVPNSQCILITGIVGFLPFVPLQCSDSVVLVCYGLI